MRSRRRDEIIDIATILFAKQGFRHTTLDAIARELKLGKTAIYHYFDGKEAVFAASVERVSKQMVEQIQSAIEGIEDPAIELETIIRTRFEVLERLTENFQIPTDVAEELGPLSQAARGSYFNAEEKLLAATISRGLEEGCFSTEDPLLEARLISAMIRGVEAMLTLGEHRNETEAHLRSLIRLITLGLRSHGPSV